MVRWLVATIVLAPTTVALAGAPNSFAKDVLPVLRRSCFECHAGRRASSGIRLDRRSTMFAIDAPLVDAKRVDDSPLLIRVTSRDPDLRMPPKGEPLPAGDVAILRRWIEDGAEWNDEAIPSEDEELHWSFVRIGVVPVPDVTDPWIASPIDAFVLQRLREHDLEPAPPADRRTLLRRVTFDLLGLPPTPEEVAAFAADERPDAYARLVDRLLASPAHGERWGRHWLDVARYADTNGLDENIAHGNAWRYRDWVVGALNEDQPYDHFLRAQLAGDLWTTDDEKTRRLRLTATGFLSLGPKVLAEVDETKMEMDIVDEQIDTVGKAMLGLTLGCARCHDHKFDAITTADYYSLAGVFKSTRTMESFTKIAKWHEVDVATPADRARRAAHEKRVGTAKQAVTAFVERANAAVRASMDDEATVPEKPEEHYPPATVAKLKALRDELATLVAKAPALPTAMGVEEGEPTDVAIHRRGDHLALGPIVRRGFPAALTNGNTSIGPHASGRREFADWLVRREHPLTARVIANRAWAGHFGRGLVATPDNFGELGEPPTHPRLLDWLATRLVDDGWWLKSLHRRIVMSNTYRQSSRPSPRSTRLDPGNRWLGRAHVRRLEAEAIRDAMLAVGGELDRTMGGSILNTENRKFVFDHTSKDRTTYDSSRRSLYLPVVRNHLYDVFQLFDYSNASTVNGQRTTSTIAPQALFLMNAPFVLDRAESLAERIVQSSTDDRDRIVRLHVLAFGRPPREIEIDRHLAFLDRVAVTLNSVPNVDSDDVADGRRRAWTSLCHTVLASSEFVTLR